MIDNIRLLTDYWTDLPTGPEGKPSPLPTDDPAALREAIKWRVGGMPSARGAEGSAIAHSILTMAQPGRLCLPGMIDGGSASGPFHLVPVEQAADCKTVDELLSWDLSGQVQLHELLADRERGQAEAEERTAPAKRERKLKKNASKAKNVDKGKGEA